MHMTVCTDECNHCPGGREARRVVQGVRGSDASADSECAGGWRALCVRSRRPAGSAAAERVAAVVGSEFEALNDGILGEFGRYLSLPGHRLRYGSEWISPRPCPASEGASGRCELIQWMARRAGTDRHPQTPSRSPPAGRPAPAARHRTSARGARSSRCHSRAGRCPPSGVGRCDDTTRHAALAALLSVDPDTIAHPHVVSPAPSIAS